METMSSMSVDATHRDLQRQFDDRLSELSAQYDRRLSRLSSTLEKAILTFEEDEALQALRRDSSPPSSFVQARVDELLREATRSDGERELKRALLQLSEHRARVAELEAAARSHAANTFEATHRSSLTLSNSAQHVSRLESHLRDATRDAEIARQSETVYRDQVESLQSHALAQSRKVESVLKEHAELQLKYAHLTEQLSLAQVHARDAELLTEATEMKARARLHGRERELADELAALKSSSQQAKEDAAADVESQLADLKLRESHDRLIALHEQQQEMEAREKRNEETWRRRVEQLEQQLMESERSSSEEISRLQSQHTADRDSLVESHRERFDQATTTHQSLVTDLKQTHQLELDQAQERIQYLLSAQQRCTDEKSSLSDQLSSHQAQQQRQIDTCVADLHALNKSLTEQVATLTSQLAIAHAVQTRTDTDAVSHSDEWKSLTARYNEVVIKYQTASTSSAHATTLLHAATQEKESLKQKYLSLGEKMERVIANVESCMAQNQSEERSKRDDLKRQYAEERLKWKSEKRALMETVSLQERKLVDLSAVVKSADEKLVDVRQFADQLTADAERERQTSAATIRQLQQDITTLQAHRKQTESDLAQKLFLIEKLMLEKTHVVDFQQSATTNANLQKDGAIATIENEFNLRAAKLRHELDQSRKDMEVASHKQQVDHELAKADLWKEAQRQMDAKLDSLRATMFTAEQVELQVSAKVDERVASISKTMLHPHQHDAVVTSKLESLRAQMRLEREVAMDDASAKHAAAIHALEQQHRMKQDELKLRYENEYTTYADGLKASIDDADNRLHRERQAAVEQTKAQAKLDAEARRLSSTVRELESRVETHHHNEQRFLSHIASQSSVIEKLKSMVDAEKSRVNELPANERRRLEHQIEEATRRFDADRAQLMRAHQEQLDSMQGILDSEKKMVRDLTDRCDARERDHRAREESLVSSHRLALDQSLARSSEQLAALESQHKSLWVSRETAWSQEVESRESLVAERIAGWESTYKTELAAREHRLTALAADLQRTRDARDKLESELEQIQRQLRDSAAILEQQTAKMTRVGAQARVNAD